MDGIQHVFIICAVLLAFAATLWTLKKRGIVRIGNVRIGSGAPRKLQVIERLQLTPQHTLCLVRLEDRMILIGTAPSSCHLIDPNGSPKCDS